MSAFLETVDQDMCGIYHFKELEGELEQGLQAALYCSATTWDYYFVQLKKQTNKQNSAE